MSKKGAESFLQKMSTPENKKYFKSVHFWAPVSNYGLPLAAYADTHKDAKLISGRMTVALCFFSAAFIRFAWKIKPRNLLLLNVHVINESLQLVQLYRCIKFHAGEGK